jgi:hypothetical protein
MIVIANNQTDLLTATVGNILHVQIDRSLKAHRASQKEAKTGFFKATYVLLQAKVQVVFDFFKKKSKAAGVVACAYAVGVGEMIKICLSLAVATVVVAALRVYAAVRSVYAKMSANWHSFSGATKRNIAGAAGIVPAFLLFCALGALPEALALAAVLSCVLVCCWRAGACAVSTILTAAFGKAPAEPPALPALPADFMPPAAF